MKVAIAYLPEEEWRANLLKSLVLEVIPDAKERESERHAPFKHIYIATRKPENHCGSKENA